MSRTKLPVHRYGNAPVLCRQICAGFTPAPTVDAGARILPIREEQLKERLGERFRELDVPLLVEWPDGRRAALLFVFEEETEPARFSIHRLAHYCLDLAELYGTDRVVPSSTSMPTWMTMNASFTPNCTRTRWPP